MPLCLHVLLLCLSVSAETTALCREAGQSVTLQCSIAGCPSSADGFDSMYLYHQLKQEHDALYYFTKSGEPDKINIRPKFTNRIQTSGTLKNNTITISNLTVDDSGLYSCVYMKGIQKRLCIVYTLAVRENANLLHEDSTLHSDAAPCSKSEEVPFATAEENRLHLTLIILGSCIISMLFTMIFILLIIPWVKQWRSSRRTTGEVSNDYVYEVMSRDGLRHLRAS